METVANQGKNDLCVRKIAHLFRMGNAESLQRRGIEHRVQWRRLELEAERTVDGMLFEKVVGIDRLRCAGIAFDT